MPEKHWFRFGMTSMKTVQLTPEFVRRYNEQERELEQLRQSVTGQPSEDCEALRRENVRLTAEMKELKGRPTPGPEVNDAEKREIEELKSRLETLDRDSRKLKAFAKDLKKKFEESESELKNVRHERDTGRSELQTLQKDREELRKRLSGLDGAKANPHDILSLRSEIQEKDELIKSLGMENALLAMQVAKLKKGSP